MSEVSQEVNNVVQAAEQVAPDVPAVEVAKAAVETVANPTSIPVLVEDLVLAHSLANDMKTKLAGKHPSLRDLVNYLFNLL